MGTIVRPPYAYSLMRADTEGQNAPPEEVRRMGFTRSLAVGVLFAMALVAAAHGASSASHAKVVGKDWARQVAPGTDERRGSAVVTRRARWGGREKTTDGRVSGTYRNAFDIWAYPDGRMHFADVEFVLKNARGAWNGSGFGARAADGSHYIFATSLGGGAHAGLRYRLFVHDKASGTAAAHTFDVDGWIERGAASATQPVVTDDVHLKVAGSSTPVQALPARGMRAGAEKTSDSRTTGKYRGTMKLWKFQDGRMHFSGTYELTSGAGSWTGEWHGIVTSDRRYIQFVDALGSGAFAGLRYRHVDTGRYPKSAPKTIKLSVDGWIESVK
jgi:hypothetical protein